MITFAKGVTSGYLPLGGVIVGARRRAVLGRAGAPDSATGPPTRATRLLRAALANLDLIEDEDLMARAARASSVRCSPRWRKVAPTIRSWTRCAAASGLLGRVRPAAPTCSTGHPWTPLMTAPSCSPRSARRAHAAARARASPSRRRSRSPTREDIDTAASAIGEALDAVAGELGPAAAA